MNNSEFKINHIGVWVKDLEKEKDFFIKYFGAKSNEMYENKISGFKSYFLTFSNDTKLELMSKPEILDKVSNSQFGFAHLAFSVKSIENVDKLTNQLKEDNFKIISPPRTTGDGYYESVVEDYEGNLIEITV